MGSIPRTSAGGIVYHVLNRANDRVRIFAGASDYRALLLVLAEAKERYPTVDIFSFSVMPNHWHFVLRPKRDGEISDFMQWFTITHSKRWRAFHRSEGYGHLYQGRFKSFPVQEDAHFLTVCRYVERNPLRAKLVDTAEEWKWSSLWYRLHGNAAQRALLSHWPVPWPRDAIRWINAPQTTTELEEIRSCVKRGKPFGETRWTQSTAQRLGLESTLRPRGRPRREGR